MPPQDADETHARRLGRKLAEARISAGYRSQQAFGDKIKLHRTTVSKMENGERPVSAEVLRRWCEICGVDYELYESSARLAWVAQTVPVPVWFQDFRKAQVLAHTIRCWHPYLVPGPLQTADYARVLHEVSIDADDLIEERVAARMDLQERTINRQPKPVTVLAVMDEAALHRQVGTPEIMHSQLMHLVEVGQRRHIGIQIVPAGRAANAGNVGPLTVASLDEGDVLLMEAMEDMTTDKGTSIKTAMAIIDQVRLDALSGQESLEKIKKVAEEWTP